MPADADIGIVGLGRMGSGIALRFAECGHTVAVHDIDGDVLDAFVAAAERDGAATRPCRDLEALAAALATPRTVMLHVPTGPPVDRVLDRLISILDAGDVVIEAGNSHFLDTVRRQRRLQEKGIGLLGVGLSGGPKGARRGASVMAGGAESAYRQVEALLRAIAARVDGRTALARVGPDGSGHFVKAVHNGIEYAAMQAIAEIGFLMRNLLGMGYEEIAAAFDSANRNLDSYLLAISARIAATSDPETGGPILDVISDRAGQKGTGRWAAEAALALEEPAPTIAEAVFARTLSLRGRDRADPLKLPTGRRPALRERERVARALPQTLEGALLISYAQGLNTLTAAGDRCDWGLDLAAICGIWRGGSVIRVRLLEDLEAAYRTRPGLANILHDPRLWDWVSVMIEDWRRVVAAAVKRGIPVPALASALAYAEGLGRPRLWTNFVQAQRDYFGGHGFERRDRPGHFHVRWEED